jgi:hypothetical protein
LLKPSNQRSQYAADGNTIVPDDQRRRLALQRSSGSGTHDFLTPTIKYLMIIIMSIQVVNLLVARTGNESATY